MEGSLQLITDPDPKWKNLRIWNIGIKFNSHLNGSVADPEWFSSNPDPTFKDVSAPDPDPVSDPSWERELRGKLALYSWNYDDI